MKVKRSSWHYKISNFGGFENCNDNLCVYFWRTVFKIIVGVLLVVFVGSILYAYFTSLFILSTTILILFLVSCVVLPVLAIHYLRKKLGKSLEMPYGNIFVGYVKAKKNKICPFIEYI